MTQPFSAEPAGRAMLRRHGRWLVVALLALVVPRLLPAATGSALDRLNAGPAPATALHSAATGQTFPGSAFFFAEGAFDPMPGTQAADTAHVFALDNGPAASAIPFRGISALDQYRATHCLTSAIYYEAGNEPEDGQRAVAQVVLNRVRHPAWPHSICGVVYQGSERADVKCQFTFSCDGAMARVPNAASWARARRIAVEAIAGIVFAPVGLATHYHTLAVRPVWAATLKPVAVVGAHIFYRWPGMNGTPQAFTIRYSGRETQSGPAPRLWAAPAMNAPLPIAPIFSLPAPYSATTYSTASYNMAPAMPVRRDDGLPQSTIKPEYRNTGRPLP